MVFTSIFTGLDVAAGGSGVILNKRGVSTEAKYAKKLKVGKISSQFRKKLGEVISAKKEGKHLAGIEDAMNWNDLRMLSDQLGVFPVVLPIVHKYTTPDPADPGKTIEVSGVVILPLDTAQWKNPRSVPILCFQHPTQVERKYSPSNCAGLTTMLDDPMYNVLLGCLMSACGYVVVIADYPGLGSDTTHPQNYCTYNLADSVIDLTDVAIEDVGDSSILRTYFKGLVKWNKMVYLMGYSEGGYATLATAKKMQIEYPEKYDVKGVVPLDGPHSLSVTMRNVMLTADSGYQSPYFLPYVLQGYDYVYNNGVGNVPEFDFMGAVKQQVDGYTGNYAAALKAMLDGSKTGEEINEFMKLAQPYAGPKSIMTETFISYLLDDGSKVVQTLQQNNSYYNWVPQMPVMMFHHIRDDLVPYQNSLLALKAFVDGGAEKVGLMPFDATVSSSGSIHSAAAPVAYALGFVWLNFLSGKDDPERLKWGRIKK